MVELPYHGGTLSMVVMAPTDPRGLTALEERLTPAFLSGCLQKLVPRDIHVLLPKFKLETDLISQRSIYGFPARLLCKRQNWL